MMHTFVRNQQNKLSKIVFVKSGTCRRLFLLLLCQDSDFRLERKRIWACLVANKVERSSSEISFIGHDHVHKLSKDVSALYSFFSWYKIMTASSRVKPRFIIGFMVNKTLVHNDDSCTFS